MRISLLQWILMAFLASVSYAKESTAQSILNKDITIRLSNVPIQSVLEQIQKDIKIKFVYSSKVSLSEHVSINASKAKLDQVLNQIFLPHGIEYSVMNQQIILSKNRVKKQEPAFSPLEEKVLNAPLTKEIRVKGKVISADGKDVLPGVSVVLKGSSAGKLRTATDFLSLQFQILNRSWFSALSGTCPRKQELATAHLLM